MSKIHIAHDFNLKIYLYKIPNENYLFSFLDKSKIKLIDINKIKKEELNKIQIYWGNRITKKALNDFPNLKWVHFASSGVSEEIKNLLKKNNIKATNSKGIFNESITQLVFTFIFLICSGVHFFNKTKKNNYNRLYFDKFIKYNNLLFEKNILILGYGQISKFLISKLKYFNKNISIVVNKKFSSIDGIKKIYLYKNINKAFEKNNLIINLLPQNSDTFKAIDGNLLKKLPKYSSFINVSRGDIINDKELINYIKKNKDFIYATDVFSREDYVNPYKPVNIDNILFSLDRVIVTPHIGAHSNNFWEKQIILFSKNLNLFLKSKKLINKLY